MKTFEESIANITKIQDKWLVYYDEDGNLCNKDGNIIEPAKKETLVFRDDETTIDESATDLSYLYEDEAVKSNSSDITEPVEEVVVPIAKNPHRL